MNNNDDIIKIKCPRDGGVLTVKRVPGIEDKYVTCPVCNTRMRFTDFTIVGAGGNSGNDDDTQYAGMQGAGAAGAERNPVPGMLTMKGQPQKTYKLRPGVNIIGRRATNSNATIQIDCPGKRMSREHLVIEVSRQPGEGYIHYARLYKSQVNATFINGLQLEDGDILELYHGNVISLPDVELIFTIPDGDETEF